MIRSEFIIRRPVFPKSMNVMQVVITLVLAVWHPDIPDSVIPAATNLIRDCLATERRDWLLLIDILHPPKRIRFKLMPGMNSAKIAAFDNMIEDSESMR